jgi:hypothetical protein
MLSSISRKIKQAQRDGSVLFKGMLSSTSGKIRFTLHTFHMALFVFDFYESLLYATLVSYENQCLEEFALRRILGSFV